MEHVVASALPAGRAARAIDRGPPSAEGIGAAPLQRLVARSCDQRIFLKAALYVAVAFAVMLWVCAPPSDHDENT